MKTAPIIVLSSEERKTLTAWSRGRSAPARLVLRAKIVLAAADNKTNESIAAECHTSKPSVGRWRTGRNPATDPRIPTVKCGLSSTRGSMPASR